MIRQHKKMILLTSIATLLPILIGLLLWEQLPDSVATHWSAGNEPDGYSSKVFAVFGLPVIMLILHLVCVIATNIDPKASSINKKIFFIVLWICPVFSIIACGSVYGYNLGYQFDIGFLCGLLVGVLYLILGNFLPTVKPNYTIGIRVMWALEDEENWTATHRFASRLWVGCGVVILLLAFLPWASVSLWIVLGLTLLASRASVLYSYIFYRKKHG